MRERKIGKKVLVFGVLFMLVFVVFAGIPMNVSAAEEPPEIEWGRYIDGSRLSVDSSGIYVVGVLFGNARDAFIRKVDLDGNPIWLKKYGGWRDDWALDVDISVEPSGTYIYVVGAAYSYYPGAFLRKYDVNGNVIWTKHFGTSIWDEARGVSVDLSDPSGVYIYVVANTGDYWGLRPSIRKYDVDGNLIWAKQFGKKHDDGAFEVSLDTSGNAYVVGNTKGAFPGQTSKGGQDVYIRKYDTNGDLVTSFGIDGTVQFGTSGNDYGNDILVDPSSGIYVAGGIGPALYPDVFIGKYDLEGKNLLWDDQFGGTNIDEANGLSLDTSGNVYVAGGVMWKGPFLKKYAADGQLKWTIWTIYSGSDVSVHSSGIYAVGSGLAKFAPSNQPPVADANELYSGDEGSPITFDASNSYDPDGDELEYRWDFDNNGIWDTVWSTDPTASYTWNDDYSGTIVVEVSDGSLTDTDSTTVEVNNVAPTITYLDVLPLVPVPVGESVSLTCEFTDSGAIDTHTWEIDWGDTITYGDVSGNTVTEPHSYGGAGVYSVSLTITDDDGGSDTAICLQYIVVYDPEGGFVTGGGWINSPAGAYVVDTTLTGKANFGFVSKYKKGADVPTGNTEFQFKAGNLNFHSSTYQWLVVAGHKAQFKGTGTINGAGNYGFMLTAVDEKLTPSTDVDMFRIKIWDKDNADAIVYDNQLGDADDSVLTKAISGGSIVIHKG